MSRTCNLAGPLPGVEAEGTVCEKKGTTCAKMLRESEARARLCRSKERVPVRAARRLCRHPDAEQELSESWDSGVSALPSSARPHVVSPIPEGVPSPVTWGTVGWVGKWV